MKKKRNYVSPNSPFVDLFIIQFGHEYCEPSHTFGPTLTHNYLFHYIASGKGKFFPPNTTDGIELFQGQGFLMPPNTICSYAADLNSPWQYYWIEFNGLQAKKIMKSIGFTDVQLIFTPNIRKKDNNITNIFSNIINSNINSEFNLLGNLFLLIDELIESSNSKKIITKDEITNAYLRLAVNYIKENYQNDISISDIATHCNLNRNYFTRLFKDELNMTPSQFLINYRLNKSTDLLLNSELSIKNISETIGYSNQFSYSAAFKKQYNVSPFDWRNKFL